MPGAFKHWTKSELLQEVIRQQTEIAALRTELADRERRYSHRNGETEEPTERGWYWIGTIYGKSIPPSTRPHFFDGKQWDNPAAVLFFKNAKWAAPDRYYGPVPVPELERGEPSHA